MAELARRAGASAGAVVFVLVGLSACRSVSIELGVLPAGAQPTVTPTVAVPAVQAPAPTATVGSVEVPTLIVATATVSPAIPSFVPLAADDGTGAAEILNSSQRDEYHVDAQKGSTTRDQRRRKGRYSNALSPSARSEWSRRGAVDHPPLRRWRAEETRQLRRVHDPNGGVPGYWSVCPDLDARSLWSARGRRTGRVRNHHQSHHRPLPIRRSTRSNPARTCPADRRSVAPALAHAGRPERCQRGINGWLQRRKRIDTDEVSQHRHLCPACGWPEHRPVPGEFIIVVRRARGVNSAWRTRLAGHRDCAALQTLVHQVDVLLWSSCHSSLD